MEQLIELISKEDAVLFVGAGLSCSAGLPSGSALLKEIYKKLPQNLQSELSNEQCNLSKISSAYINHNGNHREGLIQFIQQYFERSYPQDANKSPVGILPRTPDLAKVPYERIVPITLEQCPSMIDHVAVKTHHPPFACKNVLIQSHNQNVFTPQM